MANEIGREILPIPERKHVGLTTYDAKDPDTYYPPIEELRPPKDAPNVLVILIDDVGFGASIVFGGQPSRIQSAAVLGDTGVDDRSFYLFDYENERHALLSSTFNLNTPSEAMVCGTKGYIRIPWFPGAKELQVHRAGEKPEILKLPYGDGENFMFEIAHAMECIAAGKIESPILPLTETLAIMQTMDKLRAQWGLKYPGED